MHVDDYMDTPNADLIAFQYLSHARRPAIDQNRAWLESNAPWVTWKGQRYQCVGASRMGDIWLRDTLNRAKDSTAHYDLRVDVAELSDWTAPRLNAEDLKVTILRAANPGDLVLFHIANAFSIAGREEVLRIAEELSDFLRRKGFVPVILPDFIQPAMEEPRAANELSPVELAALIGWHERIAGQSVKDELLEKANWHRGRAHELKTIQAQLVPRCICPPGMSQMNCPACGWITAESALQKAGIPDHDATQSTDARGTGQSES